MCPPILFYLQRASKRLGEQVAELEPSPRSLNFRLLQTHWSDICTVGHSSHHLAPLEPCQEDERTHVGQPEAHASSGGPTEKLMQP